jgi:hypothetical protein
VNLKAYTWKGTAVLGALGLVLAASRSSAADGPPPATPPEMVAAYDALADAILGGIKAEKRLVKAILATTYAHAQAELAQARRAVKAGDNAAAKTALEGLAASVAQIGTEGDNAVAGVRKRLLEGGHHANSEGEKQGTFDEGYVLVSRAAKKSFLDSSQALARLAAAPKADALDAEWAKVEAAWKQHIASAK